MRILDLFEAPIEDFNLVGDWSKGASFRNKDDRKLLTNPKAQAKIIHKWQNTSVPFNLYFANVSHYQEFFLQGEVSEDWIHENMPEVADQIKISHHAVNVIYTNNTGQPREPMTAWIIAHRLGHGLAKQNFAGFLNGRSAYHTQVEEFWAVRRLVLDCMRTILEGYGVDLPQRDDAFFNRHGNILRVLFQAIGTMRSARTKTVASEFEFILELLAQYMITGKVTFNPLPLRVRYGNRGATYVTFQGPPGDYEYYNSLLRMLAEELDNHFAILMDHIVGRIFVI